MGDELIADRKKSTTPILLILVLLIGIPAVLLFNLPWQILVFLVFGAYLFSYVAKLLMSPDKPLPNPAGSAIKTPNPFTGYDYSGTKKFPEEESDNTDNDEDIDPDEEELYDELEDEMERNARTDPGVQGPGEEDGQNRPDPGNFNKIISYVEQAFSASWVRDEADLEAKLFAQLNIKFPGKVQRIEEKAIGETSITIDDAFGLDARVIESEKDLLAITGQAVFAQDNYDQVAMVLFIDRYLSSKLDIQPYVSRLEKSGIKIIVKEGFVDNKKAR